MLGRSRTRLGSAAVYLCLGVAVLLSHSCENTVTGPGGEDEIVFPDSNVSFGAHVAPLFRTKCAFTGCHGSDTFSAQGFSLDSYGHLMFGTRPVVLRGDPENSPLVWRIEGRAGTGPRMPLERQPLNGNQIRGIRTWIQEGASDN